MKIFSNFIDFMTLCIYQTKASSYKFLAPSNSQRWSYEVYEQFLKKYDHFHKKNQTDSISIKKFGKTWPFHHRILILEKFESSSKKQSLSIKKFVSVVSKRKKIFLIKKIKLFENQNQALSTKNRDDHQIIGMFVEFR